MRLRVFLGPTLDIVDARSILSADYAPPVKSGDVYRAVAHDGVEAIAILDGIFENVAAVWHKEILWALDRRIPVYGAASMGALRAAELDAFGMVGVGKIYNAFKVGRYGAFNDPFEGDDEVAIVHGPDEASRISSLALVDLRESLEIALQAGVIDDALRDLILQKGQETFYKDRTLGEITRWSAGQSKQGEAFARWLPEGFVSQKRADAIVLLKSLSATPLQAREALFTFEHTAQWQRFVDFIDKR